MDTTIQQFTASYQTSVKEFVTNILENEFGHVGIDRPDLDDISTFYQVNKGNFWIALYEGKLIGTIGLKDYNGVGYIKRMAVGKDFRGTGVAQRLLEAVTKFARKQGYRKLYLSTSPNLVAANKFYRKVRFKKIKTLPQEIPSQIAPFHFVKVL